MDTCKNKYTSIDTCYTGTVTLEFLIKDKIVKINAHNEGLPELFRIIAKCLAGYDTTKDVPIKVDLRYLTDTSYTSCLNHTIALSARRYDHDSTDDTWSAYYTAAIIKEDLKSNAIDADRTYKLYLISGKDKDMASIAIDYTPLSSIGAGAQALIEWKLTTKNS